MDTLNIRSFRAKPTSNQCFLTWYCPKKTLFRSKNLLQNSPICDIIIIQFTHGGNHAFYIRY